MKKYILYSVAIASLTATSAMAQETYESANIATQDLNGTARYIGMGGAMEALGADISTISSNPASIGLFRKSGVTITAGATTTSGDNADAASTLDFNNKKAPISFDQFGFVYAYKTSKDNFINVAFNYHKGRNFNQIVSLIGGLNGSSLNKLAYEKGYRGDVNKGGYYIDYDYQDRLIGYQNEKSPNPSNCFSQTDYLMWNVFTADANDGNSYYYNGKDYLFARDQEGYIANYDLNISGNQNDRVYWGVTLGVKSLKYYHEQVYSENIIDIKNNPAGYIDLYDSKDISGTGYDISAGIIFRPIDASPLRIGLSVTTPTWYEIKASNYTEINNNGEDTNIGQLIGRYDNGHSNDEWQYKVFTPWRLGASVGYTIGNNIALGASYEYSDYSTIDNRVITGVSYDDYYGTEETESKSDGIMNRHTKKNLTSVSTIKLGAEYKPIPELSIRAGYNYVSPMYNSDAYRTTMLNTDGCYFSSSNDYVNWKATNRFTLGVGFNIDNFTIDAAYMHSAQKGDFYPFESVQMSEGGNNYVKGTEISNNRDQFLITLGYKF